LGRNNDAHRDHTGKLSGKKNKANTRGNIGRRKRNMNDGLADSRNQHHDSKLIQSLAMGPCRYYRYDNGRVDREIFEAIGVSAYCAPVPVASLWLVGLEILNRRVSR
jgi:hypothetical protein